MRLVPPRPIPLDRALEFIREDEVVEVTRSAVRLRKAILSGTERVKRSRRERAPARG